MKKSIFAIAVFLVALVSTSEVSAQKFEGLDKSPMDAATYPNNYKISDKTIKVVYSRPQLKRRSLSKLAPAGKVWRTGANEATEITFYKDVTFGGKAIKAGTYSLFTIPAEEGDWTVILSSATNVWGSYFYKESEDVARVSGKVSKTVSTLEEFSITFSKDMTMHMGWGDTLVSVAIQ